MARRRRNNLINLKKKKNGNSKKKPKSKVKSMPKQSLDYMRLIADPCNGPLVRSVGGDLGTGIIERVRKVFSLPTSTTYNNGYVAWFPGFHNAGGYPYRGGNLFVWESTTASAAPTNTVASPLGSGLSSVTGVFYADPAYAVIAGTSPFSRAKTTSACIQLQTTQAISNIRGAICMVARMSLAAFDQNSGVAASVFQPPSVEQLLTYGMKRERLQIDGHEVIWAPSERDSTLKTDAASQQGSQIAGHNEPDAAMWMGLIGTKETVVATPDPTNVMGIVMVWSGTAAENSFLQFSCVKTIEAELAPRSNAVEPPPVAKASSSPGVYDTVASVVDKMDEVAPGWRTRAVNMAATAGAKIASMAFTGSPLLGTYSNTAMKLLM